MYIHELARKISLRRLEVPSIRAAVLAALAAGNVGGFVREIPRAMPSQVIASRRSDDNATQLVDGPDYKVPQLAPRVPEPEPMPPSRGMTYLMRQQDPYWDNHDAIRSSIAQSRNAEVLRNAALLASLSAQ